jgi:DNA polymerase-3 subunit beta
MKFIIDRDVLVNCLSDVVKAVNSRGMYSALSCVKINASDAENRVVFTTTDTSFLIEIGVDCNCVFPGEVLVDAKKLYEIASSLPSGDVTILCDYETMLISIRISKVKFSIHALSVEGFPVTDRIESFFDIDAKALVEAINLVSVSVARFGAEMGSNVLCGCFLSVGREGLELAGIDGNRLSIKGVELSGVDDEVRSAILPIKFLVEVARVANKYDGVISVGMTGEKVSFSFGGRYMLSSVIVGRYPDYRRLIPDNYEIEALIDREGLIKALKRCSLMANDRTNTIKLGFSDRSLVLNCSTPEFGDASDVLEVEFSGSLNIAFNYRYLLDILQVMDCVEVRFEFGGSLAPALIKPDIDDSFTYLVMPVQVKD